MVPLVMLLLLVSLVQTGGYHPALLEVEDNMIVYDSGTEEPFCYPGANHPSESIFKVSSEATARNIGRVLCRSLGYTHLVREYGVPANDIMGTPLLIFCLGYERLIDQCTADKGAKNDCNEFLSLECGRCSENRQVKMDETIEITSPEYPNYADAAVCEWQLRAPATASFTLKFLNFRLPNTDSKGNCYVGFLEVSREMNEERLEVMVRCGSAVPIPLTVQADVLFLRFSSGTFYPRPYNSRRGFKVLVTASSIPWSSRRLDTMENVSIGLGVLLFLVIFLVVLFIMKRRSWTRRRSKQRKLMEERLVSQRPSYHEVALTAMLAGMATNPPRHQMHQVDGDMTAITSRRGGSLREAGRRDGAEPSVKMMCVARTNSVPLQQTNCPPLPSRLPASAPPPARRQQTLPTIEAEQEPCSVEEQPIYMEVDECNRSLFQSYVELKDLEQFREEVKVAVPPGNPVLCAPVSPRLLSPTARHCSSQPHLCPDQPSSSSPTFEKLFSSRLNVWPSSSSLSPSIKSLPPIGKTYASKISVGGHVNSRIHNSLSSRASSLSSNVENVSPYSSRTPIGSLHLSPFPRERSTSSGLSSCGLAEGRNIEHRRLPAVHVDGSPLLNTTVLERQLRVASFSSCESVFTVDGSGMTAPRGCACGFVHEKRTSSPEQGQQLSKSCGDVSRAPSIPKQQDSMLELVRSEPSLPRSHNTPRLVGPVLRRVSQMFFGSSPFLSNSSEAMKDSGADGPEDETRPEKNGTRTWRLGKNASRRAFSSSGIYCPFKYSRLQNVCISDKRKASSCSDFKETDVTQGVAPTQST